MGKGIIRHSRARDLSSDIVSESEGGWLAERTAFFFDLEMLLPHQPIARGFERAKRMVESKLHHVVRRKDRIFWTVSGFYLVVASRDVAQAWTVAERVKEYILAHCVQTQGAPPPSALAVRLASVADLHSFSLRSA